MSEKEVVLRCGVCGRPGVKEGYMFRDARTGDKGFVCLWCQKWDLDAWLRSLGIDPDGPLELVHGPDN